MTEQHCPEDRVLERPNYFAGMILTESDFEVEQTYFLDKSRAHNRLHGWGVVCGLAVVPTRPPSTSVLVEPGVALDCCGREIVMTEPVAADVGEAAADRRVLVVVEYAETDVGPVPVHGPEGPQSLPGRRREAAKLSVTDAPPVEPPDLAPPADGVVACPECPDPAVTLAVLDLQGGRTVTADRIDNTRRRIVAVHPPGRDSLHRLSAEVGLLRRRVEALGTALAVVAVGAVVSLVRAGCRTAAG